jgi:hypothetical protein
MSIILDLLPKSFTVVFLVAVVTPVHISLVHALDRRLGLFGIHWMRHKNNSAPDEGGETRKIRYEISVLTVWFAATLCFMSILLYSNPMRAGSSGLILKVMATLFFFASILSLLQTIVYAHYRVASKSSDTLRKHLLRILKNFRTYTWNALVLPIILGLSLVDVFLCISANALFGVLLYYYYFLELNDDIVEEFSLGVPGVPPTGVSTVVG